MASPWGQSGDDRRSGDDESSGRRGLGRWTRDDQHGPDGDQAWLGGSSGGSGSSGGGRGSSSGIADDRSRNEPRGPVFSSDFDDGSAADDGRRGLRDRRARGARDDLGSGSGSGSAPGPAREPGEPEFFANLSKGAKSLVRLVVIGFVGFFIVRFAGRRNFEGWNADAFFGLPTWTVLLIVVVLVWVFRGMRRR
ncbi:hypothetical protein ACXET9_15100 [Brachybacterium sp. DNPG3]